MHTNLIKQQPAARQHCAWSTPGCLLAVISSPCGQPRLFLSSGARRKHMSVSCKHPALSSARLTATNKHLWLLLAARCGVLNMLREASSPLVPHKHMINTSSFSKVCFAPGSVGCSLTLTVPDVSVLNPYLLSTLPLWPLGCMV